MVKFVHTDMFSRFYCLDAYKTLHPHPGRRLPEGGIREQGVHLEPEAAKSWFSILIQDQWQNINMINPRNPGDCCKHQVDKYIIHGLLRKKKIAPDDYLEKLMNYKDENRTLNFIMATYLPNVCQNMILEVGFGPGQLRTSFHPSVVEGAPYVLAGEELGDVGIGQIQSKTFDFYNVRSELTFRWFKHNIMCRDHQWICQDEAESSNQKLNMKKGGGGKKGSRKGKGKN